MILLAGAAFLMHGLARSSDSLQKLAADQIRLALNRIGKAGALGVAVGALLTMLMQSSGAMTATMVNLANARVLLLRDAMGLLIGSGIGAALTIALISLRAASLGLPLFFAGFLFAFFARSARARDAFELVMGIGLLFFGLELIGVGAAGFFDSPYAASAIAFLRDHPVAATAASAILTGALQSSTAVLGIVMSLATAGVIDVDSASFWVYGANIGTASTSIIASLRGNYLGRQIAWANALYRAASVLIFLPFAAVLIAIFRDRFTEPASQIAALYAAINLFSASIFFPLRALGASAIQRLVRPDAGEDEFGLRFLRRSTYESFAMGLAHAKRALLEMGERLYDMAELSILLFDRYDADAFTRTQRLDSKVDALLKEIKLFLIRVSQDSPEGMNHAAIELISFGSELEAAADVLDHSIATLAGKMHAQRLEFSVEAAADLRLLHAAVLRSITVALGAFQTEDRSLAQSALEAKREARAIESRAREAHISRLAGQNSDSFAASAKFLDALAAYVQISELVSKSAGRTVRSASGSVAASS